jgi:hypothetical protein
MVQGNVENRLTFEDTCLHKIIAFFRPGDMKAVCFNMNAGTMNLNFMISKLIPTEKHNIASDHPEIIRQVEAIIRKEHTASSSPLWRMSLLDD